ncbi:MAG TPA: DUF58 domain-containing protein [Acidimicrobiia bacterium]|nr:DUF58 domain-containing protein [Acidimicrobiia bacterium]
MSFTARSLWAMSAAAIGTVFLPTLVGAAVLTAVVAISVADAWAVRSAPVVDRAAPGALSRAVPGEVVVSSPHPRTRLRQPVASPDLVVEPQEGEGRLTASIVAMRRGRHRLAPVSTRRIGPLGLGAWYHRVGDAHEIVVYPDLPAAARLATEVRVGMFREEGRRARGPLGLGTELESIREYQPDDDIRQVNWRATVRTGHPMSNTYRIEQDRDVICMLDCGRLMASSLTRPDGVELTRLDAAVDALAAVAAVADELGDRIGVVAFADRILRSVAPRRDGADAAVDAVYDLEPAGVDSDYEAAVSVVAARKRSFVLILTDLLDPGAARALIGSVPALTRHHNLVVATVRDPAVRHALETASAGEAELARTVVAADVSARKEAVQAALRARGVEVLEAPAQELSRRCVGAYVRAKRLARV